MSFLPMYLIYLQMWVQEALSYFSKDVVKKVDKQ
jgi:hypothetical protein